MITFYATNRRRHELKRMQMYEGGSGLVKFDFTSWAADNGAVGSVVWTVEHGDASIASESLSSNVAQAQITTSQAGRSLIKLVATSGSDIDVRYIEIMSRAPEIVTGLYGFCA